MENIIFKNEKKEYKKNDLVIFSGEKLDSIFYLKEGIIEVRKLKNKVKSKTSSEIKKNSIRVFLVGKNSYLEPENLMNDKHKYCFIAYSNCKINKYTLGNKNRLDFFRNNSSFSYNLLLNEVDLLYKNYRNILKFLSFIGEIEKITDNLNLGLSYVLNKKNSKIQEKFKGNDGILPIKIDSKFILEDHSDKLEKQYINIKYLKSIKSFEKKVMFYYNLIKPKSKEFEAIISENINVFIYSYDEIAKDLKKFLNEIDILLSKIIDELEIFFIRKESPINIVLENAEKIMNSGKVSDKFEEGLSLICENFNNILKKITDKNYDNVIKRVKSLKKYDNEKEDLYNFKKMLKNSRNIIIEFSGIDKSDAFIVSRTIDKLNSFDFKKSEFDERKQFLNILSNNFIDLYYGVFINAIKDLHSIPTIVKMFLYFGVIDENILEENQLEFLYDYVEEIENSGYLDYPILTLFDFLKNIYFQKDQPSLSKDGLDFEKIIKNDSSNKYQDTPEGRVKFELENMIKECLRITSDNSKQFIPFLTKSKLGESFESYKNAPLILEKELESINEVDISLFFRELSWRSKDSSERIQKEVKPYFILMPSIGLRGQVWQEMVNNDRNSRGRILIPILFKTDIKKELVKVLARYRWNLGKFLAGSLWMDPAQGGFVGAFYDFTQYYNKIPNLSSDGKESIKKLFSKMKNDADRFEYFYERWVMYEKDGVSKVNKFVREIFFRYIYFSKEIRSNLASMPMFSRLNTKFSNLREKDIKALEAKYKKYMNQDGKIPADLQEYINLLKK